MLVMLFYHGHKTAVAILFIIGWSSDYRLENKAMSKRNVYPEPGTWVVDDKYGLPPTGPPDDLTSESVSVNQLTEAVAYHGLGYCIHSYISPEKIKDIKLRKLWQHARRDMIAVLECIEELRNGPRNATPIRKNKSGTVIGEKLL